MKSFDYWQRKKVLWRRYIPYLLLHVDLGFASMRTSIAHRKLENLEYEYVSLSIKIFNRGFDIALYTTDKRIIYRG